MRTRSFLAVATAALAMLGLTACGGSSATSSSASSSLSVTDAWVKSSEGPMTAVFGKITNPTGSDITISAATTSAGSMAELHEVVMKDGQMVMQPKPGGFVVPANGSLVLEPGGNHIMVMGMSAAVGPGQDVSVTLTLSNGQTLAFTAVAKDYSGGNESYEPSGAHSSMSMG